jgi:hypothetical protein
MRAWAMVAALILSTATIAADGPDPSESAVPPELAGFSPLIGAWKGMGIPATNRLKGWPERHLWAWKFAKGHPVGLSLAIEGGKFITKGELAFDPATKRYRLDGRDADRKAVSYSGPVDKSGRVLTLERAANESSGKERITIRINSNQIRYTIWLDRQDPGAPQFHRVIDVNMGKEGEQFAAGASSSELPKCIITGGSATLAVSYDGKSYPICCTGCRDEFLESPAKYIKKAQLRAQNTPKTKPSSSVGKDDGAFDGLVDEPKSDKPASKPKDAPRSDPKD